MAIKMRSLLLTRGARKTLISMKWVLRHEKLEELCLKMERNWKANASRLPKWVWRINLCCPNFYSLFLETISKFPTFPFAAWSCSSSLASLFVWTVGSWTLSQCSLHTSNTVANLAQGLKVTLLKEGEYKTQHGVYRWKWDRRGWRKRAGMVIWAWESKKSAEELCQEPQEGTEPRNDWAEECLVLGP